jgi:murein L,D-transpeptidase YafK
MSRSTRRARSLFGAIAILSLTGSCQYMPGVVAALFGAPPRPPYPAAPTTPTVPAPPPQADRIVVFKQQRLLELLRQGEVVARYPIALGEHPRGAKERQGDGRTPEGRYVIDRRSANTRYTDELHISYPNAADRARARTMRIEPGGAIFIHGLPRDYGPFDPTKWYRDWTDGCIAVGNLAIKKIWDAVPDGTPIDIVP